MQDKIKSNCCHSSISCFHGYPGEVIYNVLSFSWVLMKISWKQFMELLSQAIPNRLTNYCASRYDQITQFEQTLSLSMENILLSHDSYFSVHQFCVLFWIQEFLKMRSKGFCTVLLWEVVLLELNSAANLVILSWRMFVKDILMWRITSVLL